MVRPDPFMKGVNSIYGACDLMAFSRKTKLKMAAKGARFVHVMHVWSNVRVFFQISRINTQTP